MKYLEITVGKSMNPLTGENWLRADAKVSVGEDEVAKDVFEKVKAEINSWLPIPGHQMSVPQEPPNANDKELGALEREKTILAYYDIINMKGASAKYLESHRKYIEAIGDEALTEAFNNKIKSLQ